MDHDNDGNQLPAPERRPDLQRRRLLQRIGLAGLTAYAAPALAGLEVTIARASGASGASGGGGGRGGGGGGGGPGGGGSGVASRPRRAVRAQPQRATPTRRRAPPPPPEIIVVLPDGVNPALIENAGYRILGQRRSGTLARQVLRLAMPGGRDAEAAQAEIALLVPGALADRNALYRTEAFLCEDGDCASHAMIGWSGWPSAFAPKIGMIDTGINPEHPALVGQRLRVIGVDMADRSAAGRKHGTSVATQLIGRLDSAVPGLLPMAELIAVEAFHLSSNGAETADAFGLVEALDLLAAERVSVINMSLSGPPNAVLEQMTATVAGRGIFLVAAAGNGGPGAPPAYPAAWPHVVAVTAVDAKGNVYRQANQGPWITLAAPGVNLWSAASISGGRLKSGTSYAAPFVTAALAVERMRAPAEPMDQTLDRMLSCAKDLGEAGHDPIFGHGLVSSPNQCVAGSGELFSISGE